MDTINIIIITAVLNAIITGVIGGLVMYRIQKKIDNSYFQQQTVFIKNYGKMVETLETIYQKYSKHVSSLSDFINNYKNNREISKENDEFPEFDLMSKPLNELHDYYTNNKIYLPEKSATFISERIWKGHLLVALVGTHSVDVPKEAIPSLVEFTNKVLDSMDLKLEKIVAEKYNVEGVLGALYQETRVMLEEIGSYYREISNVK